MNNYSKITALYSRLSVGDEDREGGESNSIQNQKTFLESYAQQQQLTNIKNYIDDDESGRFFDRSGYAQRKLIGSIDRLSKNKISRNRSTKSSITKPTAASWHYTKPQNATSKHA